MQEHGEKTTIGLISKKATLHVQHTFFVPSFTVVLHDCNVKLLETFLWRKCRTCSRSLFFTAAHFLLALVAARISHFVTAATKFSCRSSNKKMCLLCFLSLALDLCRPFSRWVSLAWRFFPFFSVFLLLCIPILAASALQDAGGYAISRQNNIKLHLGCHTCWLRHLTLVFLWRRRTVGRTVTWLPKFLGWVDYHIFLLMVLRCARFARESSAIIIVIIIIIIIIIVVAVVSLLFKLLLSF